MAKQYNTTIPPKNDPPDFYAEWLPEKPTTKPTARFERLISIQNTKQYNELRNMSMPKEIPQPNLLKIYAKKNGKWEHMGYKCVECGKPMSDPTVLEKHKLLCKVDKKINKKDLEEQHILSRIGNKIVEETFEDPFAELEEE